ncbi:MAG: sensor histidine kinase [Planctomycetota bacterium]|nr:MAG: sensor histidine kinase [Planctomycetota bacterium]
MHTLPSLVTPRGSRRLPLAEPTAERLALGLLANGAGRNVHFEAALAGDPALAVWTLARAYAAGEDALRSIAELASWLANQPASFFTGGQTPEPAAAEDLRRRSSTLSGRSLAAAALAEQFARDGAADAQPSRFLALVHGAAEWVAIDGEAPDASALFPPWLHSTLEELRRPAEHQSPEVACAARALRAVAAQDEDTPTKLGEAWARQGPWGASFNELVERLRVLAQLQHDFAGALETAKLEALKNLAYGAGHEINNPLANISARAQTMLAEEQDPERRRMLGAINAQAFRAHEMIADMMLFARPPAPQPEPADLVPLLAGVADELAPQAEEQGSEIRADLPQGPLVVAIDATQIAVAVRSLCVNALEALVTGGTVQIELLPPAKPHEAVRIAVRDDGPGIAAEVRPHVFDPFYSGREAGRGLGLGLSKCWRIVTGHGGRIDVESGPGQGAVFTITLPPGNTR